MLTGKELGAAIESARLAKGVSKKKLANDFGVAPPSVQGWVKTGRIDKSKLMELIEYFSDVAKPEHWGLSERISGFLSASGAGSGEKEEKDKESNVITADFSRHRVREGEIDIPQFDIRGSMGHGQVVPADYVETIRNITVSTDYLRAQGVSYTKPENLAVVTGFGESMNKTFNSGDPLIIDKGVLEVVTDGVYFFTLANVLYIKRLQRLPSMIRMISDNDAFPPYDIKGADLESLIIHARVLLAWNAKKL